MTFEEIYRQNHRSVYLLANRMVNNEEASKDITQDVFIKLYNTPGKGECINNVQAWLSRVTYNRSLNFLRKSNRTRQYNGHAILSNARDAELKIIEAEESAMIENIVKSLKNREQILIRLYSAGMSYREISEITGIKFSSVGSTLARTLKKIRNKYHEKERQMP